VQVVPGVTVSSNPIIALCTRVPPLNGVLDIFTSGDEEMCVVVDNELFLDTLHKSAMASAVDKLSAELAFKANVDAVSRDYVCEPHLGACMILGLLWIGINQITPDYRLWVMQNTGPLLESVALLS